MITWQKLALVAVLILVFFGKGKVSDLMGDLAKGIKAFKKGMAEDDAAPAKVEVDAPPEVKEEPKRIEHQNTAPVHEVAKSDVTEEKSSSNT